LKRWNFLALGLALTLQTVALAQAPAGSGSPAAGAEHSAQALAVYEEGKRLYDARDYSGALRKFDEAAALEPGKARWQYNRGLALRKLDRFEEARQAFLQSRSLDPTYKRAEIDDKLREMGFSTEDPPSSSGSPTVPGAVSESDAAREPDRNSFGYKLGQVIGYGICFGIPVAIVVGIVLLIRRLTRKNAAAGASSRSTPSAPSAPGGPLSPKLVAELSQLDERLERVSNSLVTAEHSLRLEEDADLRALLNQATMAEQRAREELDRARQRKAQPASVDAQVRAAEQAATAARERARALFGDRAFIPEGERLGCYFCARPLANAKFRMQVPLKQGAETAPVLACPPCANMAAAGQVPPMKVRVTKEGRSLHWSELDGYDPYIHRHKPYPGTSMVPAWSYTPQRSLAEVAALAAGGALAGGAVAYGVSQLLDLDGAREAAASLAATQAAAARATQRREERDWKDHS
jgi:tetratricopeptide (TPR) repeat protein